MKNKKLKIIMASLVVLAFLVCGLLFLKSAHAFTFGGKGSSITIGTPGNSPFGEGDIDKSIGRIFDVIITISEVAFVLLFLIGGIMYLTSMGDEEASKKAKKLLIDAVIGLIIVLAAWAIGTWVINQLTGEGGTGISPAASSAGEGVGTAPTLPQGTATNPPATPPVVTPTPTPTD